MLKSKKCSSCKFYQSKMFQDMGASSDGCKFYENELHLHWSFCLFDNDVSNDFVCPFYQLRMNFKSSNIVGEIANLLSKTYRDLFKDLDIRMHGEIVDEIDDEDDDEIDDD